MRIFPNTLQKHFGVSYEAANIKIDTINNYYTFFNTKYDKTIHKLFYNEIKKVLWDNETIFLDYK